MKTKPTIFIHCGLANSSSKLDVKNFWSVLYADELIPNFQMIKQTCKTDFSLILTSKTVIYFFIKNVLLDYDQSEKNILENCREIYFVGKKSFNYFQERLSELNIPLHIQLFYSLKMGIKNLLNEFNLKALSKNLVVFSAAGGRTQEVIQSYKFNDPKKVYFVPLYTLIPQPSAFLETFFNEYQILENKFVFCCRSGMVLNTAVQFLNSYFYEKDKRAHLRGDDSLPANIYFLPFGESTLDKLYEFKLMERIGVCMEPAELKERIEKELGGTCTVSEFSGGNDHYSVVVVSPNFTGKTLIQRHRMIMDLFQDEIKTGEVHALTIKAFTPEQLEQEAR